MKTKAKLFGVAILVVLLSITIPPAVAQVDDSVIASLQPMPMLPKPKAMPAGTYMKTIQDRGRLLCGVAVDKPMFGYLDPKTADFQGFDPDICRLIARQILGNEAQVQFVSVTSDQRIPALQQGLVDVVASTMTINAKRKEQILFSEVYFVAAQRLLVRSDSNVKNIRDLKAGARICAAKGSTSVASISKLHPEATAFSASNYGECLARFQLGEVDAITTDDVILAGLASQDPYAMVVGEKLSVEPYGLGVHKENREFVRFVNAVLKAAKQDGTWTDLFNKWLSKLGSAPEPPRAVYIP